MSNLGTVNDVQLSPANEHSHPNLSASANDSIMKPPTSADDDYVWDIFYHRPTTLSEWNDLANIGMLSSFPASLFDEDYDSESESELEDEADEDSNDENFYKNDYPDEESDVSDDYGSGGLSSLPYNPVNSRTFTVDEWHESSDYDDMVGNRNEREEFDF